jgi:hypothetical protein
MSKNLVILTKHIGNIFNSKYLFVFMINLKKKNLKF